MNDTPAPAPRSPRRILILGGGHVGLHVARRLEKRLRRGEATVTIVDSRPYMTYQPFLPEVAGGSIEPRHAVAPLTSVLKRTEVVTAAVAAISAADRSVTVRSAEGTKQVLPFDELVIALGSVARVLPLPGLAEHGIGFKYIEEAVAARNVVLSQLAQASAIKDTEARRAALTFVVVGGGFAGVEALAELEDLAKDSLTRYPALRREDLRFVLVEHAQKILPEVGDELGKWTAARLEGRGIEVRMGTAMSSCVDKHVVLTDGTEFDAATIIWAAGVQPNPILHDSDLPLGPRGHIDTLPTLQVKDLEGVWAAGDNAQVPDLAVGEGAWCAPNAQHAVRQARLLADNLATSLRGNTPRSYRHPYAGSVASLGLNKGAAKIYGITLRGWPAWMMHRVYHVAQMPSLNRKGRITVGWLVNMVTARDTVPLPELHHPRAAFAEAAQPVGTPST